MKQKPTFFIALAATLAVLFLVSSRAVALNLWASGGNVMYLPSVFRPAPTPATEWVFSTIDSSHTAANMNSHSLRLDSNGNPHVAYGSDHLYYASYNGSSWSVQTVDGASDVGSYASLILDSKNAPHISYYDAANKHLKYAHWNGSDWDVEVVDSTADTGMYSSIAVNSDDVPRIAYLYIYTTTSGSTNYLKYATKGSYSWTKSTLDSYDAGEYISMAMDSEDEPHVSYYDAANGNLKYAYMVSSTWYYQTLDIVDDVGAFSSIAIDATDNAHIAYLDATTNALMYIYWDGFNWILTKVDSGNKVGSYASLALDAAGNPRISYYDSTKDDLRFAYTNGSITAAWTIKIVDSTGNVGKFTSIAVDARGIPHISYYDATNKRLQYAVRTSAP